MKYIIETRAQNEAALVIIDLLMKSDPEADSREAECLKFLAEQVQNWETENIPQMNRDKWKNNGI
jgi:antitoxin component HigA of HigAB toxin-antitoxin module